jgi:hypothetical protein
MKLKQWIVVLVFGFIIGMVGAWMKILHKPFADLLMTTSLVIKIIAIVAIALKLIRSKRMRDLMNE